MEILVIIGSVILGLFFLVWLGLRIEPVSFPAFTGQSSTIKTVPLPESLPAPVERFVVRFDTETGRLSSLESMRFKRTEDDFKTLWLNKALGWEEIAGHRPVNVGAVTRMDEGKPWAVFTVEEFVYNRDVQSYICATGP